MALCEELFSSLESKRNHSHRSMKNGGYPQAACKEVQYEGTIGIPKGLSLPLSLGM
jgi:hypothetical protein